MSIIGYSNDKRLEARREPGKRFLSVYRAPFLFAIFLEPPREAKKSAYQKEFRYFSFTAGLGAFFFGLYKKAGIFEPDNPEKYEFERKSIQIFEK